MLPAAFPSPPQGAVHLGPVPLRGYALMVVIGIVVALVIAARRLQRRGYAPGVVVDVAIWAIPFGLVGARLWNVAVDNDLYFRAGRDWVRAFEIWDGGLGIWGAVLLGAVGGWIGARRWTVRPAHLADALAVGLPVGMAIGRVGNYLNSELYGRPSTLPWAVRIGVDHRQPDLHAVATYQPTFLYELLWDLGVALLVLGAERWGWFGRLARGRAFALAVAAYCAGRVWIELLRIDPTPHLLGLRFNVWTAIVGFVVAVGYLLRVRATAADEAAPAHAGERQAWRRPRPAPPVLAAPIGALAMSTGARHAGTSAPAPALPPGPVADPLSALRRRHHQEDR